MLLPGFFLSTLAFMQLPQPQAVQPHTIRSEDLFAQATLPEFAEQSWLLGGDTQSWVIKAMSPIPPSPSVTDASGPSDRGDSSSSPAVGTKRKGLDASDSLTDIESRIIQKSRMTDPGEIVGSNKGEESVDGVECRTDIISAEGLSLNKKMWQGRLPPTQNGCSWQGTTHLWISNMWQILSGMTPDQLQDANRLCPFPIKRRLILQDLGFMDGDKAELDFCFSLCDIGTWTIYPIAVIDMCCIYNLYHTIMITISCNGMHVNFIHHCQDITISMSCPSLSASFMGTVSSERLQMLMNMLLDLTHFAVGGRHTRRIMEDHFGNDIFPDENTLKTLPANLTYLHIDIVMLVREKSSTLGVCPRVIHWLSSLDTHVSLTTLELKLFTNDIRVGRNLLALYTFIGSAFVDLSKMLHLKHFHIMTSELCLHELLNVVQTIRSPDFEDVNICVTLTSFEHTFAGLKSWDAAYVAEELQAITVINLSVLMKELQPQAAVHNFYNGLVIAQASNMRNDGFMHVFWFKDRGFLARFTDVTGSWC
ncbi:hypothetical protein ARMGADRAFT_1022456 [Armillaria gallica]|uniref:Uncharacterized protein n=1 Tax=Armillaria gallica TaxID=47427 RepID=A0A2H3EU25_ARMGA|nr:hypothetical protein ARMGADRAFT_1022456 [Armillaria gallica]